MKHLEHPASLNVLEQYKQAAQVLQKTSRSTRPAWYKSALELDFQEHIFVDGASVLTFFYNRSKNQWSEGLQISNSTFTDSEKTKEFGETLIAKAIALKGKSVGCVLHIADEFSTAELKPKYDNPGDLNELREMIYEQPEEVLEDSSMPTDQASWRVLPYPAAGGNTIATTISLSRRSDEFLKRLRDLGNEQNFPLITHAVCAPLVAIMDLPNMIQRGIDKPFVAVLQYPWFTAMAFFNEHSDLRLIRAIQHRKQPCPSNFWSAVATSNASVEFVDPDIFLLPLGAEIGTRVSEDLRYHFPDSNVETIMFPEVPELPSWAPELALSVAEVSEQDAENQSHTFGALRTEGWYLQDFLSPSEEEVTLFPSRNEMRLLRLFKFAKLGLVALVLLSLLSMSFSVIRIISKEEWSFDESQAMKVKQRMTMLGQESKRLDHWNSLLEDRSKGWSSMEMVSRLFPAKSGILVQTFTHTVKPDPVPGQVKAGFIKQWEISGMAREEALSYLNSLNSTEGISAKFGKVAKFTGDSAYDPSPKTRSIVVNIKTRENARFRRALGEDADDFDANTYPFSFNLSISQRFEAADPLAIPVAKAP